MRPVPGGRSGDKGVAVEGPRTAVPSTGPLCHLCSSSAAGLPRPERARPATRTDARRSHDVDIAPTRVLYTRDQPGPANIEFVLQRSHGAAYADRVVLSEGACMGRPDFDEVLEDKVVEDDGISRADR